MKVEIHGKKDYLINQQLVSGWSCPQCENISSLLKEEEMMELVEAFDKLDENLDTQVTLEEFLKYQVGFGLLITSNTTVSKNLGYLFKA